MSDTGLCNSQPDCDDGEAADKEQEDVLVLETDLSSVENMSSCQENVTPQTDDCSHYVSWTVYIALAVPTGKPVKQNMNYLTLTPQEKSLLQYILQTDGRFFSSFT